MAQTFYSIHDQSIAHAGIKGMKWGLRRFRNYDGTLTSAGKERYDYYDEKGGKKSKATAESKSAAKKTAPKSTSGGMKAIRRAEKERKRRAEILSDPKKLQKHYSEFTTKELEDAQRKFAIQNSLTAQYRKEQADAKEAKRAEKRARAEAKYSLKAQKERLEQEKLRTKSSEVDLQQKVERHKSSEERLAAEEGRKADKDKKEAKSTAWKQRMLKLSNILTISKNGKEIFDSLGITDPKSGNNLFDALGSAMGWKDQPASSVTSGGSSKGNTNTGNSAAPVSFGSNSDVNAQRAKDVRALEKMQAKYDKQQLKERQATQKAELKKASALEAEGKRIEKEYYRLAQRQKDEQEFAIQRALSGPDSKRALERSEQYGTERALTNPKAVTTAGSIASSLSERVGAFIKEVNEEKWTDAYKTHEYYSKLSNKRRDRATSKLAIKEHGEPKLESTEYYNKIKGLFDTNISEVLDKYKG